MNFLKIFKRKKISQMAGVPVAEFIRIADIPKDASEDDVIRMIHSDFDSAQERLLQIARDIITKKSIATPSVKQQIQDLKALGFVNVPLVKEYEPRIEMEDIEKTRSLALAKKIEYYKKTYPFQKFLTLLELDRICRKYGLVYAPVANYIKDIPEKNLKEIKEAKSLKSEDAEITKFKLIRPDHPKVFQELMNKLGHPDATFTQQEIIDILKEYYQGREVPEWTHQAKETTWLYVVSRELGYDDSRHSYRGVEIIDRSGLYIAAPKEHFQDLDKLSQDNFGYIQTIKTIVKTDPVVFRYCVGGIQVLTKWGAEARDESLAILEEN